MTLLALIVAHAGCPLCAAGACLEGPVSAGMESPCHFLGTAHGGAVHLHSVHGCDTPELQLADLTSASWRESFQRDRTIAPARELGVAFDEHWTQLARQGGARPIEMEAPPPNFCSSAARAVLRI